MMNPHPPIHILRITCRDAIGLVAKVTAVLSRHGCNVLANGEFVDEVSGTFFMRTVFTGEADGDTVVDEIRGVLPDDAVVERRRQRTRRMVIMATREPHVIGDLLLRCEYDDLDAEVVAVIANHDDLRGLASKFGVPFYHVPHAGLEREEHEARVGRILDTLEFDLLVMAKYMRILSADFIHRYLYRLVNIHHSFLPAFIGAQPYRQAYERGVKIIGATAHYATADLDEGPIIAQDVLPVTHAYNPRDLARAGRDIEKTVLARALKLVIEERVFVHGNRTILFD